MLTWNKISIIHMLTVCTVHQKFTFSLFILYFILYLKCLSKLARLDFCFTLDVWPTVSRTTMFGFFFFFRDSWLQSQKSHSPFTFHSCFTPYQKNSLVHSQSLYLILQNLIQQVFCELYTFSGTVSGTGSIRIVNVCVLGVRNELCSVDNSEIGLPCAAFSKLSSVDISFANPH